MLADGLKGDGGFVLSAFGFGDVTSVLGGKFSGLFLETTEVFFGEDDEFLFSEGEGLDGHGGGPPKESKDYNIRGGGAGRGRWDGGDSGVANFPGLGS